MRNLLRRLNALQLLALGFLLIILLGAFALMIPAANRYANAPSFLDALFTAASATCVTGLVVFDTYTQFTFFGQLIILFLIQIGGLGFMVLAALLAMAVGRRIGLKERSVLMEAVSAGQLGGVVHLAKRILIGTAIIEGAGAMLLAFRFVPLLGPAHGAWYAVFHSVSAFCNAGFDLMGRFEAYSSLTRFAGDAYVLLTVSALIVIGGIGFSVWNDFVDNGFRLRKYRLHTKIMLAGTAALIVLFTGLFLIVERDHTLGGMSPGARVLCAFFEAISPRTAGFNSVDLTAMSGGGSLLTVFLMFVGAGPGSTGGGVKIPTVVLALAATGAYFRKRGEVDIGKRRVPATLVNRAFSSLTVYLALALSAVIILVCVQQLPVTDSLIEIFSAIGTVGLSTGITRQLNPAMKIMVILLMYGGRVGSLSVMMAVARPQQAKTRLPEENIII